MNRRLMTSESVTEGHPDKMCDQISDAVLDAIIREDKDARVACETCMTTGLILIMGEITTSTYVPLADVARAVVLDIGYNSSKVGFDGNSCAVMVAVHEQSSDISQGVSCALEARDEAGDCQLTGAGDQGMMFGYASNETPELMPMALALSHRLTRRMSELRKSGFLPFLRPDGKAQVTIVYENGLPKSVETIVISTQHDEKVSQEEIREAMQRHVIPHCVPEQLLHPETRYFINPSGRFVIGGPAGDSGLTGRKIIVDTYGGYAPHGGGCFSGKDPTKVDRSAAYMARYAAKNVVAAGLADKCQIALAYAIGVAEPVSFSVDTFGTGKADEAAIARAVSESFDFRPDGIIKELDLRRPIYRQTACYGHFGRNDLNLPWERTDKVQEIKRRL